MVTPLRYQRTVLGIDPGADGGFALVGDESAEVWPMAATPTAILAALRLHGRPDFAVLEDVHAMPGQGVTSCFSFGQALGVLQGLLAAQFIPVVTVSPQRWQRHILGELPGKGNKAPVIAWAKKTFPTLNLLRTAKCSKPHDGMCDALAIASWGRYAYSFLL